MSKKRKGDDVALTEEQIKRILKKIVQDADQSIIRYINTEQGGKQKRKTTTYRVCPMCDRAVGNFGTNFKNHFRKCCPTIYDELTKYQPLYFGTWNQLIESGLIKGKVIEDEEQLELMLRRTSNYHELCREEGIAPIGDEDDLSVMSEEIYEESSNHNDDDSTEPTSTPVANMEGDELKRFMRSLAKEQKKQTRSRPKKKKQDSSPVPSVSSTRSEQHLGLNMMTPSTPGFLFNDKMFSPMTPGFASPMMGNFSPLAIPQSAQMESWLINPTQFVNQAIEEVITKESKLEASSLDLGSEDFSMLQATSSIPQTSSLNISESFDETLYKQALQRYLKNNSYIHEIFFGRIGDLPEDNCSHLKELTNEIEHMLNQTDHELERDERIIDTFISTQQEFYDTLNSLHKGMTDSEFKDKKRILSQILSKQHYHSQAAKKPKQETEKPKQLIEL